jgi:hypothetical protein
MIAEPLSISLAVTNIIGFIGFVRNTIVTLYGDLKTLENAPSYVKDIINDLQTHHLAMEEWRDQWLAYEENWSLFGHMRGPEDKPDAL